MSIDQAPSPSPLDRVERIIAASDDALAAAGPDRADELLGLGEMALENWLASKDAQPTRSTVEGFRLLALHRQGTKGDPSFNACRETCRELVFLCNCIRLGSNPAEVANHVRLAAMVVRHLILFIDGKLEVAGLGEFCCSSRTLRAQDAVALAHR